MCKLCQDNGGAKWCTFFVVVVLQIRCFRVCGFLYIGNANFGAADVFGSCFFQPQSQSLFRPWIKWKTFPVSLTAFRCSCSQRARYICSRRRDPLRFNFDSKSWCHYPQRSKAKAAGANQSNEHAHRCTHTHPPTHKHILSPTHTCAESISRIGGGGRILWIELHTRTLLLRVLRQSV